MPKTRTRTCSGRKALASGDTPALRRADPVVRDWVMKMFAGTPPKRRPAAK